MCVCGGGGPVYFSESPVTGVTGNKQDAVEEVVTGGAKKRNPNPF